MDGVTLRKARSSPHLDWPLSAEEKKGCVLRLYDKDVQAANELIRSSEEKLEAMQEQLAKARIADGTPPWNLSEQITLVPEVTLDSRSSKPMAVEQPAIVDADDTEDAADKLRATIAAATAALQALENAKVKKDPPSRKSEQSNFSQGRQRSRSEGPLVGILCKDPQRRSRGSSLGGEKRRVSFGAVDADDIPARELADSPEKPTSMSEIKHKVSVQESTAQASGVEPEPEIFAPDLVAEAAVASPVPTQANEHVGSASVRSRSVDGFRSAPGLFRFDGQIMKDIAGGSSNTCRPVEEEQREDSRPPLSPEEATLHSTLTAFYEKRRIEGKLALVERISRRYAHDGLPELWASIATKYTLPPAAAVQWLASTLGPLMPVQWPKEDLPESASRALAALARARVKARSSGGAEMPQELHTLRTTALQSALDAGDLDAIRALSFYGCPDSSLRPQLWRALLSRPARGNHRCSSQKALEERRAAYRQWHSRAINADNSEPSTTSTIKEASLRAALRREVETEARACWRGEAFMKQPEVFNAVVSIAFTTAVRYSRHIRGSCDVAALLLFALSEGQSEELASAEADAFFCLTHLINELQGTIAEDQNHEGRSKVRRFHWLLRTYDPGLAELLATNNLTALPATRLGVAFCTRAGFSLEICVRIWDSLLADPRRFEMGDQAVLALLLLPVTRGRLFQQRHDVGNLAEALLAAPRTVDPEALLRTMFAICAFERRCGQDSQIPYPPQPGVLDAIANSALDGLSRVWGGVRARWKAGREAASTFQPLAQVQAQHNRKPSATASDHSQMERTAVDRRSMNRSCSSDSSQFAALSLGII